MSSASPASLGDVPRFAAARGPERTAIVADARDVTYAELELETQALAAALTHRGVGPGDRVAILLPNVIGFFAAYFAVARLGAISVPLGTRLTAEEIRFLLGHSSSGVIVHDDATEPLARAVAAGGTSTGLLNIDETRSGATGTEATQSTVLREHDAAIFYTSGTTAHPKGVRLTHRAVLNCASIVTQRFEIEERDVALSVLPLHHTATHFTALPTLMRGGTVILREGFRPRQAFELLERFSVTLFPTVTTMAILMANDAESGSPEWDLGALRKVFVGGSGVPDAIVHAWRRFAPAASIVNCYGLTEMAPAVACMDPHVMSSRDGSVGLPYPGIEVRVVRDNGTEAAPGEVGEFAVRGDSMMSGYWDNDDASAQALRDGWLYTGDLGQRDDDGYLSISGRKKHMVKRGGENVFPDEVEAALIRDHRVKEVIVVAVPDDVMGERVGAMVSIEPGSVMTPEEVVASCRDTLADFKLPEYVQVLDRELPKNSVGKVDARGILAAVHDGTVDWTDLRRGRAGAREQRPRNHQLHDLA